MSVFDNSSRMCKLQKMSANLEKSENLGWKGVSELWGRVEEVWEGAVWRHIGHITESESKPKSEPKNESESSLLFC